MQRDALCAYVMDVHYGAVTVSDSGIVCCQFSCGCVVVNRWSSECDSNVVCVTEHCAECTAETAEHFESRRSAERSRLRRRPSCKTRGLQGQTDGRAGTRLGRRAGRWASEWPKSSQNRALVVTIQQRRLQLLSIQTCKTMMLNVRPRSIPSDSPVRP